MNFSSLQPIDAAVTLAVIWIGLGVAGLAFMRAPRVITGIIFPAGAVVSLALAAAGLWAIGAPASSAILPAGLPDLPFHVRADPLAGFFLLLTGGVACGVSLFAAGYFRDTGGAALGLLSLQYHVFLASMAFVLIADDAYLFMVTWESMALSSYFLVTTEHHDEQNRKAGFIYLVIAHLGAIGILLCFGVLHGGHGDYTFDALRAANLFRRGPPTQHGPSSGSDPRVGSRTGGGKRYPRRTLGGSGPLLAPLCRICSSNRLTVFTASAPDDRVRCQVRLLNR